MKLLFEINGQLTKNSYLPVSLLLNMSVVRIWLYHLIAGLNYEWNGDRISESRGRVVVELLFLVFRMDKGISKLSVSFFRGGIDHRHLCVLEGRLYSSS